MDDQEKPAAQSSVEGVTAKIADLKAKAEGAEESEKPGIMDEIHKLEAEKDSLAAKAQSYEADATKIEGEAKTAESDVTNAENALKGLHL